MVVARALKMTAQEELEFLGDRDHGILGMIDASERLVGRVVGYSLRRGAVVLHGFDLPALERERPACLVVDSFPSIRELKMLTLRGRVRRARDVVCFHVESSWGIDYSKGRSSGLTTDGRDPA